MLPRDVTVYLAIAPVDLRAGFDRLSGIVTEHLQCDPRVGNLYVLPTGVARTRRSCFMIEPAIAFCSKDWIVDISPYPP
jgi:hypothetical protein